METTDMERPSTYLEYLPELYQRDADKGGFTGRYLRIFEKMLSGIDDGVTVRNGDHGDVPLEGIEQLLERIHEFFDPDLAPAEFLKWLGRWVALTVSDDWREVSQRRILKRIMSLYRIRGTKQGLQEYLELFAGPNVTIDENMEGIVVGSYQPVGTEVQGTATVGVDTYVGGMAPHMFVVTITFSEIEDIGFVHRSIDSTRAILDLEKPAHTRYALRFQFPGIVVGTRSTVGVDTIIGSQYPVFV